MNNSFEIADIIVAYVQGKSLHEQMELLSKWLEESEDNKRFFIELLNEDAFSSYKSAREDVDVDKAFEKVKKRKARHLHKKNRRLGWGLATASITILLTIAGIVSYIHVDQNQDGKELSVAMNKYGQKKAVLVDEKGNRMPIDALDTFIDNDNSNIRVTKEGALIYENQEGNLYANLEYHTLETPRGSEFQIILPDGTKVWLNADSKLKYPVSFIGKERRVELTGEAYFDVVRDEELPFIVQTSRSAVRVLGTEFCVEDYEEKENLVTLVRGSVSVESLHGHIRVIIPGQQTVIEGDSIRVENVETMYFTAWKDGYFIFQKMTLKKVMEELAKWYDFEYCFANADVANILITARLKKYDDIDVILDILSDTKEVYFSQKGKVITVGRTCR